MELPKSIVFGGRAEGQAEDGAWARELTPSKEGVSLRFASLAMARDEMYEGVIVV